MDTNINSHGEFVPSLTDRVMLNHLKDMWMLATRKFLSLRILLICLRRKGGCFHFPTMEKLVA